MSTQGQHTFKDRLVTPEEATRSIERGRSIFIGSGAAEPNVLVEALVTHGQHLDGFIKRDSDRLKRFTPRFQRAMVQLGMKARGRIGRLDLPVLLLLAEEDAATDNAATLSAFANTKVKPEIHVLPGAHGLQFDAGEELARHIVQFVMAHRSAANVQRQ